MSGIFLLFLFVYFVVLMPSHLFWTCIICGSLWLLYHRKYPLVLLMVVMVLRWLYPVDDVSFPVTGYVTKVSDASFQMITRYGTVLCIAEQQVDLDSIVSIDGKLLNQTSSSTFAYASQVADFTIVCHQIEEKMQFPGIRFLIFQKIMDIKDPVTQSFLKKAVLRLSDDALVGMEFIQVAFFLRVFKSILRRFLSEKKVQWIELGLIVFFGALWSLPFLCFRLLYFRLMKLCSLSRVDRLGLFGCLVWMISTRLVSSASFWTVFVLYLGLTSCFHRGAILFLFYLLQLCFMHTVDLFDVMLFQVHQIHSMVSFLFGVIGLMTGIKVDWWINYLEWFSCLMPSFQINGSVSLMGILVVIFLFSRRSSNQQIIISFATLLFFSVFGTDPFSRVVFLNVGQGDATLITSPLSFSTILIDTGPPSSYWQLKNSLYAQSVKTIDLLILTHQDSDHSGNLENLLRDFHVERIWDNTMNIRMDDQFPFVQINELNSSQTENENSLVLVVSINDLNFLFSADATKRQEELYSQQLDEQMQFCKIGHHGSDTSTSWALLDELGCKVALISAGVNNRYGHPDEAVLQRLKANDSIVYNTAEAGDIKIVMTRFLNLITTSSNESVIIIKE